MLQGGSRPISLIITHQCIMIIAQEHILNQPTLYIPPMYLDITLNHVNTVVTYTQDDLPQLHGDDGELDICQELL